ncbi:uncharacterized protein LOC113206048 [Frankliniella occidentalis]|uniref:Uncharacterized protein LOC113206048 n=1 Tax=Frankliniella occidentalis TaxID=133901 RepID=A0A6J1SAR3_FRAOC|nr:uncharacterized protein LOC113206048 [Frankliniella occidentalis]
MGCGCKKNICNNKRCKCVKTEGKKCDETCACDPHKCENRKETVDKEQYEEGKDEAQNLKEEDEIKEDAQQAQKKCTWEDMERKLREQYSKDVQHLRKAKNASKIVPRNLEDIVVKRENEIETVLQNMAKMDINENKYEVLGTEEWLDFERKQTPCTICKRKFQPDRIAKHEDICRRRSRTSKIEVSF